MVKIVFDTEDDQFCDENGNKVEEFIKIYTIRILEKIVSDIENWDDYGAIMSVNGNKLGTWEID